MMSLVVVAVHVASKVGLDCVTAIPVQSPWRSPPVLCNAQCRPGWLGVPWALVSEHPPAPRDLDGAHMVASTIEKNVKWKSLYCWQLLNLSITVLIVSYRARIVLLPSSLNHLFNAVIQNKGLCIFKTWTDLHYQDLVIIIDWFIDSCRWLTLCRTRVYPMVKRDPKLHGSCTMLHAHGKCLRRM